jgi:hypothetical protein
MRRAVLALVVICGVLSILLLYVEVSSLPLLSEAGARRSQPLTGRTVG